MKRPTNIDLLECIRQLFTEWLDFHPEDRSETERDIQRLALEISSRGIAFFTLNLPEVDKFLCLSLAQERLSPIGLPFTRGYKRGSSIPRLFKGFWIRIFGPDGRIRQDADPDAIEYLRTILCIGKALRLECAPNRVHNAIKEFIDVEEKLPVPSDLWSGSEKELNRGSIGSLSDFAIRGGLFDQPGNRNVEDQELFDILSTCQRIADSVVSSLKYESPGEYDDSFGLPELPYDPSGYLSTKVFMPRHGPGVVSDLPSSKFKYDFGSWPERLEKRFPFGKYGTSSPDAFLNGSVPFVYPSDEEGASTLLAVPKTAKTPRLIAAEPMCNQWIQQGVSNALRKRVEQHRLLGRSINFFDQTPSRRGALQASYDGERATLDLSSASDRLSASVVQRIFRGDLNLLQDLVACRTRFVRGTRLANRWPGGASQLLRVRKYASMGSALTFPIQSIVFAILCAGVGHFENARRPVRSSRHGTIAVWDQVRVYGDDLIVPVGWVNKLVQVLHTLGLKVNVEKSFSTGFFRESCGLDAFRGYDVTPSRIRPTSSSLATREALGWLDTVNNLWLRGHWRLSNYLRETAPWAKKLPVVNCRSRAIGWASFCSGLSPSLKKRVKWDPNLQEDVITVNRLVIGKPRANQVESWNSMTAWFAEREPSVTQFDRLFETEAHWTSVSEYISKKSMMPALIRRTRIPLHSFALRMAH